MGKRIDYTHFLDENQRRDGYGLELHDHGKSFDVAISYHGDEIGGIEGNVLGSEIQITDADAGHYGKGLGQTAYEAAYDYFLSRGISKAFSGDASQDAIAMHRRLATKHGLGLLVEDHEDEDGWWQSWSYDLKQLAGRGVTGTSAADSSAPRSRPRSGRHRKTR